MNSEWTEFSRIFYIRYNAHQLVSTTMGNFRYGEILQNNNKFTRVPDLFKLMHLSQAYKTLTQDHVI